MARRVVYYIGSTYIGYGQKGEISPEINNDTIPTFDGNVPDIGVEPSYELSIDRLRYAGTLAEFIEVETIIHSLRKTPQNIKIVEKFTLPSKETVKVKEIIYNCTLTDKKPTFDAETRTVENITIKGTTMRKWINDEEIPV